MGKTKTKYIPFGVYEYEYMESWLEDLAGKGWLLTGMFSCFATFEECEPRKLRYRIVPNAIGRAKAEEVAFYEESGWKHAGSSRGMDVFYCEDNHAAELFTDRQSFARRARGYAIAAGLAVLSCGYLAWDNLFHGFRLFSSEDGVLHTIHDMGILRYTGLTVLILLAVIMSLRAMVKYAGHARRIVGAKPLPGRGSFRRVAVLNKTIMLAGLLSVALMIIGWAGASL
ncbi:MAG: DUF2812 domain-containing protein [Firmicutes bacterium]|nr:DUF2812 domain-containing protein [Bacillota bacterium]